MDKGDVFDDDDGDREITVARVSCEAPAAAVELNETKKNATIPVARGTCTSSVMGRQAMSTLMQNNLLA